MKYFLLAFVTIAANCLVLSWCQTTMKTESALDDPGRKCMLQENVHPQYAIDFANGRIKPQDVTPGFKCFIRCVVEEGKFITKDGEIMEENIVKAAGNITSVEQLRKIISNCKTVKGNNPCETSFNIYVCISSELK